MISLFIEKEIIFWDFDGVIKESNACKADAYENLFLPYGENVSKKVRRHHDFNGGMSRFDKIPIYLNWAGLVSKKSLVNEFCNKFSELVYRAVIDSPNVPGVTEYLERNFKRQYFVLVTATPQREIEKILKEYLGETNVFDYIDTALMNNDNETTLADIRKNINAWMGKYPLHK
jgi:beta-phosphoglucomutase-like phosphatase (HAD superfamily)